MLTDIGLAKQAADFAAAVTEIGVGTGTTAASATDTTLEAEVPTVGRFSVVGATSSGPTATIQGFSDNFPSSADVAEVGLFGANGLLLRNIQTPKTVPQNTACVITVTITQTNTL